MKNWKKKYASKLISADGAAASIKNGDRVYLGSLCAEPTAIISALSSSRLEDVELIQFVAGFAATQLAATGSERFKMKTFFIGRRSGESADPSESDYVPLFHSQIPIFFRNRRIPIDVAIVQVSLPDKRGRFSLGISVDVTRSAVEAARTVIAQVNPKMPRTRGQTLIEAEKINFLVESEEELYELPEEVIGDRERKISKYCSELIEDGCVVQFGFAGISQGLMDFLRDRKDLGVHTEILTDAIMDLMEAGAINNSQKKTHRRKSIATCCMGTRRLYDYVDDNAIVELFPSDIVLNPSLISSNDRMVAVNLALEVDLRGQIRQGKPTWTAFEGSGGDHDFMTGATLSQGGRSIVCLRSTSLKSGRSTIVPSFGPKSAVMINRGDVNFVVTEYGIAYLGGKSVRERAMALIEVAHPDNRENLMKEARELGYVYTNQVYYRLASPQLREKVRHYHTFKGGLKGHVRVAKPTDESMMRDLFYHLSESSVYFRYFSPRRSMPHANLEKYVNLIEEDGLSIVVTVLPREHRRIIAEARYMFSRNHDFPDTAFMVDESYQGRGIATYLLHYLIDIARERGIKGFRGEVIFGNQPMLKVYETVPYVVHKTLEDGIVTVRFSFDELKQDDTDENNPMI